MGCLLAIIVILVGGLGDAIVVWLVWNILSTIFMLPHMSFYLAMAIGIFISLISGPKNRD